MPQIRKRCENTVSPIPSFLFRCVSQPPPLRGTSFRRKEGESVKNHLPPSQGRGMPEGQGVGRRRKSEANLRRYAPPPSRGRRESRVTAPKPFLRRKETMREYRFPRTVISSASEKSFSFAVKKKWESIGKWETPYSIRFGITAFHAGIKNPLKQFGD